MYNMPQGRLRVKPAMTFARLHHAIFIPMQS